MVAPDPTDVGLVGLTLVMDLVALLRQHDDIAAGRPVPTFAFDSSPALVGLLGADMLGMTMRRFQTDPAAVWARIEEASREQDDPLSEKVRSAGRTLMAFLAAPPRPFRARLSEIEALDDLPMFLSILAAILSQVLGVLGLTPEALGKVLASDEVEGF